MYQVGAGNADITPFLMDIGLMGYGANWNVAKGIETRIHSRAFVIKSGGKTVVFVNLEICFPTILMKHAALIKLKEKGYAYDDEAFMLTAQHTHSAPSGYSHYFFYNMNTNGHRKEVFNRYVDGIVESVCEAEEHCQPATLSFNSGAFGVDIPVAFNRSLRAYNMNPDIDKKLNKEERHLGVDRNMQLLRFDDKQGRPIGLINWFGVHTTSLSNDNTKINYDNKGYAADYFETYLKDQGHQFPITIFAQGAAGDVTPNFVLDKKKNWLRGKFEDDLQSAQFNGNLQFEKAKEIFEDCPDNSEQVTGELDYSAMYVDFSNAKIDPEFTGGQLNQRTSQPCIGVSFLQGTKEGPGLHKISCQLFTFCDFFVRNYRKYIYSNFISYKERVVMMHTYEAQHPKVLALEMGDGRIMGTKRVRNLIMPGFIDPTMAGLKKLDRTGHMKQKPWEPDILQLQLIVIGQLALVGIPAELTTMSGKRIRNQILNLLKERGVTAVILCPYANGYSGYITTFEEYQVQAYEGGHTVFGKWTLAAYQTKLKILANELLLPSGQRDRETAIDVKLGPRIVPEDKVWTGFYH